MNRNAVIALLAATLLMYGCSAPGGKSLKADYVAFYQPTCTMDQVIDFDCLIGVWRSADDTSTAFVFEDDPIGYEMDWWLDSTRVIDAWILPYLQGQYLLVDIYMELIDFWWLPMPDVFMLPTHQIGRIDMVVDTLRFSLLDRSWLFNHLSDHPEELEHEVNAFGYLLITSSTEEIQTFLALRERELEFTEVTSLHRPEEWKD